MILKKPIFIIIIMSLLSTLMLAAPQPALAVEGVCPDGTDLIAKYEWSSVGGWVFEKYYDIIVITGNAQSGTWVSGGVPIEAVVITDGQEPDGDVITWTYGPWTPGVTSGTYDAADMMPEQTPPHNISNIVFCGDIFPVTLNSFTANANRGIVTIEWVTATEIDTAGFLVYKSLTAGGPEVKVVESLIAAEGSGTSGASYAITDAPGYGTFYYWLKDVDYSGQSSLYGPVVVKVLPSIRQPVYRPSLPVQ